MADPFFTDVAGPIRSADPDSTDPLDLQGLRARPARPRQAHGGPPPDRRLLLALVRLAGLGHVRRRDVRPAVARRRRATRWPAARDRRWPPPSSSSTSSASRSTASTTATSRPRARRFAETDANLDALVDDAAAHQERTGVRLLWGTANLFTHPRYAGRAPPPTPIPRSSPTPRRRSSRCSRSRSGSAARTTSSGAAARATTRCSTPTSRREGAQLARFLHLVAEHKHRIGFEGTLLIEPKPKEPTKHQYDYDTATVHGFLVRNGLEGEYSVNIEANHATLAGHSFHHEVAYAVANGILGSIDANRGDPQNGWDTDQFPNSVEDLALPLYEILRGGGFAPGGFNFDAKLRRQSIDRDDLFHAHIGGIDTLARALLVAADMIERGAWPSCARRATRAGAARSGAAILDGAETLASLEATGRGRRDRPAPGVGPAGAARERREPAHLGGRSAG